MDPHQPPLTPYEEGQVLLIDKPYGWTSFQVVNKLKWQIRNQERLRKLKIGHAGTLDPLATGLLIVCTGKFTKRIDSFQSQEKEYTGTMMLGATTPCFDMEKPIDNHYPTEHIHDSDLLRIAAQFEGEQMQVPPIFSAVKIDGKRAYSYARQEQEVEIQAKNICISTFEITRIALPEVDFRVVCSKGTYIRSLARDFGLALDSGAHLTRLRRSRIGNYTVEQTLTFDETQDKFLIPCFSEN